MWFLVKKFIAVIVSAFLTLFPNSEFLKSFDALELATQRENCLLNATIVSDIHIDVEWPIGEWAYSFSGSTNFNPFNTNVSVLSFTTFIDTDSPAVQGL